MTGEEIDDQREVTPPPPKAKEPETVTLTKAEVEALKRERDEARESERFWAQRARGGGQQEPEPETEEEEIDTDGLVPKVTGDAEIDAAIFENPEKWTEALTQGPRAIGAYIKSLGLVSAKEAAEIAVKAARGVVESRVQAMQTDNKLVGDFKDLQDPTSELFKTAAPIYQEAVRMNGGKQSSALLWAAAKAAKAQLEAKTPPARTRREESEDPYDRYEPEEDRRARTRAQGSDRGRPAPVVDDEADGLGPEALAMIAEMNRSGPKITPEDFIASQKQLGTGRRRR